MLFEVKEFNTDFLGCCYKITRSVFLPSSLSLGDFVLQKSRSWGACKDDMNLTSLFGGMEIFSESFEGYTHDNTTGTLESKLS